MAGQAYEKIMDETLIQPTYKPTFGEALLDDVDPLRGVLRPRPGNV